MNLQPIEPLTLREEEIFALSRNGNSCKKIASILFIDEETVRSHRKHILQKFNLSGKKAFLKSYVAITPKLLCIDSLVLASKLFTVASVLLTTKLSVLDW